MATTTSSSRTTSNASLVMSDSSHQGQGQGSQHHRISRSAGGGRRVRTAIVKQPGLNRSITAPVGNPQLHQRFNRCATVPSKQAKQEQTEQEEQPEAKPVPHFRRSNTTFRSRLRQSSRQSITRMSLFGVHAASKRNLERMESTRDVDLLEMDLGDIDLHESKKIDVNPEDTPEPRSSAASWIAGWFNGGTGGGEPQEQKRESTAPTKDTHIVANWPWSQHSRGGETASTQPLHADEFGGDDDHSGYEFQEDHSNNKPLYEAQQQRTGFGGYPQAREEEKDAVQEFIEARLSTFWSNIDVLTGGNGLKHHVDWDDDDELPPEEMEETSSSSHVSRLSAAGGHYGFTEEYEARYNY